MTPYLGFWCFLGGLFGFLVLHFGLFEFSNNFWNYSKLGRVYFLHFGHMSHHLGRREGWSGSTHIKRDLNLGIAQKGGVPGLLKLLGALFY